MTFDRAHHADRERRPLVLQEEEIRSISIFMYYFSRIAKN